MRRFNPLGGFRAGGTPSSASGSQGKRLEFSGQTATCSLSFSYRAEDIDPDFGLFVTLMVSTEVAAQFVDRRLAPDLIIMDRSWSLNIGIPDNGATVVDFGALVL